MNLVIPDFLPVLGNGAHDDPSEGACFMEYTALLAGEPFSDGPECVDGQLGTFMQSVNDGLCDYDRPMLVPFLGRGIGLTVPNKPSYEFDVRKNPRFKPLFTHPTPYGAQLDPRRALIHERDQHWKELCDVYNADVFQLRLKAMRRMAQRFKIARTLKDDPHDLSTWAFEHLIDRAQRIGSGAPLPARHKAIVLRWVTAMHESYEEAMDELGFIRSYEPVCQLTDVIPQVCQHV